MRRLWGAALGVAMLIMPLIADAQQYGPSRYYTMVGEDPDRSTHTWQVEVRRRLDFGVYRGGRFFWEVLVQPQSVFLNGEQGFVWQKEFATPVLMDGASDTYCEALTNTVCAEPFDGTFIGKRFRPTTAWARVGYMPPGADPYDWDYTEDETIVTLTTVTPEPGTFALVGGGLGLLAFAGTRRRRGGRG